jgi:hypothetical protein
MSDKPAIMPLGQALWILAEAHTREDHQTGFTVETTPQHNLAEYIEAWRSLRYNIGKPTEAEGK